MTAKVRILVQLIDVVPTGAGGVREVVEVRLRGRAGKLASRTGREMM